MAFRRAAESFALVTFACALLGAAAPAPTASPPAPAGTETIPSPDAIYLRAVRALKDAPQPAFVVFRERVAGRNIRVTCLADGFSLTLKHGDAAGDYNVWYRVRDEAALSEDVSSHRRCGGALLYPAGKTVAALGAPTAAPSGSPATPAPSATSADASSGLGAGPALIASVRADGVRFYRVTFAGEEPFEGHRVYRLALHAYRDPNEHPLTGMIVDAETFLPRQLAGEVSGRYVVANGRAAGTVTFDRAGDYWVLREENFELALNALFVHARSSVVVDASDFAFPESVPVALPTPKPSATPAAR